MTMGTSHHWKLLSALILVVVVLASIGSYLTFYEQIGKPKVSTSTTISSTRITTRPTTTQPLYKLYGKLFFDYNGNAIQEAGEPPLPNVVVSLDGRNVTATNSTGWYVINDVVEGNHTLRPYPPSSFHYMWESIYEFRSVTEPYKISVGNYTRKDLGFGHGFLTWPFPKGTHFERDDYLGRDSVVDIGTLGGGSPRAYDPTIGTRCVGGLCVEPGHTGIDIGVAVGTRFVAAAPLTIRNLGYSAEGSNAIFVLYQNGLSGMYSHAKLLPNVTVGQKIPRGQEFGYVDAPPKVGKSHLHWQLNEGNMPVDPYADLLKKNDVSLWTVWNDPRYP